MTHLMRALLAVAVIAASAPALGWNDLGHMTIAAAAYAQLTPAARHRAAELLVLNPSYGTWVADAPSEERELIAFMKAATWADEIKHSPEYRNDGEQPLGPQAARNSGYTDPLQHRYWHFVDVPLAPEGIPAPPPRAPNVLTQIVLFRATLRSPRASDPLKSYDLVWLIHLVGDVHQPLHTVTRYTREQPEGDAGGNRVMLCQPPCRRELHAFWDDLLGRGRDPQVALRLAGELPPPPPRLVGIEDPDAWVGESVDIARSAVYVAPIGLGPGPYRLNPQYRTRAHRIARARIALAAARLARLLNEVLQ
jgi:S1/P1 Nuclease